MAVYFKYFALCEKAVPEPHSTLPLGFGFGLHPTPLAPVIPACSSRENLTCAYRGASNIEHSATPESTSCWFPLIPDCKGNVYGMRASPIRKTILQQTEPCLPQHGSFICSRMWFNTRLTWGSPHLTPTDLFMVTVGARVYGSHRAGAASGDLCHVHL